MEIKIPEIKSSKSSKEALVEILKSISPYVIVTGSYAYGTQTEHSDIDFYITAVPEEEVDYEAAYVEDTYCKPLIRMFENLGYTWESVFIGSFSVDNNIYIPLEFSSYYSIEDEIFEIEILGVKMNAAKSNHTSENYINGRKIR